MSFNWLALLLEAALKGSLLLVAAGGATHLCRRRSAAVRHRIWAAAAFCMLALPVVSLVLPSWSTVVSAPAPAAPGPQAHQPANDLALPSMAVRAAASAIAVSAGSIARGIWFAGFAWGAGSLLIGSAYLAYRTRRSRLLLSRDWIRIAAELSAKYDLPRPARLLISPHRTMPLTWGVLRPRILLPPDAETWPEDRIRVVLAHELAHVRRRDWLTQMLGELGRTVYWFNPLMWICCDHLRQESEQACDDVVLLSGVQGPAYAEQLLGLAQSLSSSEHAWSVSLAMARQSHLERRFNAMLNSSTNRQGVTRSAGYLMTTAALCLLIPLASLRAPAQNMSGKFTGTVLDASGAAVPNATIIMSNARARTKDMTASGPAGSFEFETLNAGSYTLEVLKPGFARYNAPVQLEANRGQHQNVTLQLGVVDARIDVVGEGHAKSTETSSAATPQRIKIGGDVQASKITKMVRPAYPPNAKAAGITGTVLLEAVISKEGEPLSLRVMNSQVDPDLARSAVESVSQWRFQPTLLNGDPVEVITQITVNFTLSQ